MARNTSQELVAEDRRREVAALRRRRLTMRQIVAALEKAGRINPITNEPWSLATIKRDLDTLTAAARSEALKDVSEHKAEILADYDELMRLAWQEKRYEDIRKVLKDVRDLLGTDAPQVIVFEQVARRMDEAITALEREFADDPVLLDRALGALVAGPGRGPAYGAN
jgi:hypothetical protein